MATTTAGSRTTSLKSTASRSVSKIHCYEIALYALSVRNVANFSPAVFERHQGSPSEFQILDI